VEVVPVPVGEQRCEDATGGVDAATAWVKPCARQVPSPLDGEAVAGRREVRAREVLLRPFLALARPLVPSFLSGIEMTIGRLREAVKAGWESHVRRVGAGI